MNKSGRVKVTVVLLFVFVLVGLVSGVGDLGLPVGSSVVQSWAGVGNFTLLRNGCSSPVSCEAEFSFLPLVDFSVSSGSVWLGADVVRGGVGNLELFEEVCSDVHVYGSYGLCVPFNETVYDIVNQTSYFREYSNCSVAQGAQVGVRSSCSLDPLGGSVNFQRDSVRTFVVKGNVKPNTFADWKLNFSGFSPAWAFWNSSWDCYVNLSAFEPSGLARTYAFVSENFNPLVEWNTCAVPYNASVRLLEYLGNGSYSEVTTQISNSSVNATGFMNSFNLNWQSNFTAFENKTYALYVKGSSDPAGYVNPFTLATTVNDDFAAYRVNNSFYGFVFDDDMQLMQVHDRVDGVMALDASMGANDQSIGVKTETMPSVAKNGHTNSDSLYTIINDGPVFREFTVSISGKQLTWRVYSRGGIVDFSIARVNSTSTATRLVFNGVRGDGVANKLTTSVYWNKTHVGDEARQQVEVGRAFWSMIDTPNSATYIPTVAIDEDQFMLVNLTVTINQNLIGMFLYLGSGLGSYQDPDGASWINENVTLRLGAFKTDGNPTAAKARVAANLTYQDLVRPVVVSKLSESFGNSFPVLSGVPDNSTNEDIVPSNHWYNLSLYANDAEDRDDQLTYAVVSQSNSTLISCFVVGGFYLNCTLPSLDAYGNSTINVSVTDTGGLADSDVFIVTVLAVNDAPVIVSFNASSLNRTFVETGQNASFAENESVRFSASVNDADNDVLSFSWLLDSVQQALTAFWDWSTGFFTAGTHNVTLYVNDSQNATFNYWNVQIGNKIKETFTVDFASPTPADNSNLPSTAINVSFTINPYTTQTPQPAEIVHDAQAEFNGTFSSTEYNTSQSAVQLTAGSLNGTYTSAILDLGGNISWKNISWAETEPRAGLATETGQVALWRMDEASWTGAPNEVIDSSSNSNHGYSFSSATTASTAMFNRSGNFPGNQNDYLYTGKSGFPSGSSARTMEAWIRTSENFAGTYAGILAYGVSANNQYSALAVYDNRLYFDSGGDAARAVIGNATINDGKWHHVAFTLLSNGTGTLYIDGQIDKTKVFTTMNTDVANGDSRIGHYVLAGAPYAFKGQIDDAAIWNQTLNSTEIQTHYQAKISALNVEIRSCDDPACSGETYTAPYTDGTLNTLTLPNNRYIQYRTNLGTNNQDYNPKLTSITIKGDTIVPTPTYTPGSAWIEFDGTNYSDLSGSGNSFSRVFNNLLTGTHTYRAHANNTYADPNFTETRTANVPSYNITFNITSGENGIGLNSTTITCNYTGFSQGGNTTNPYGPFQFPTGNWQCTFVKINMYNKNLIFVADNNKVVSVIMEREFSFTIQEHDWLRELYECVVSGDCTAYRLWNSTNRTVEKIWNEYLPTDRSVVTREDNISLTLSATQNISINYTLNIPFKEGYNNNELLPIRIFYWFTDTSGKCYSQDKQTDANNAANPYCVPLIATYLGPNNGTTEFRVDLRPNLPAGTYQITRQIDIDPIENGKQTWKTYGREKTAQITVLGNSIDNALENTVKPGRTTAKALNSGLESITGAATSAFEDSNPITMLIALAMICLTMITISYFKHVKGKL